MKIREMIIQLMNEIMNHTQLKNVKTWKLATSDAHGLYKKYGFDSLENPQNLMERKRNTMANDSYN